MASYPYLFALSVALFGQPVSTRLFGVELGSIPARLRLDFSPEGEVRDPSWTHGGDAAGIVALEYVCHAERRCFATPSSAQFYFVDDKLAAVTLRADDSAGASGVAPASVMETVRGKLGWGPPAARAESAGRRVAYYLHEGWTAVWVQDGPDTEVKLYLDALAPIGRVEAVAAGAAGGAELTALPGALDYLRGHRAVGRGDWEAAVEALSKLVAAKGAPTLLVEQARLVLAMSLAAAVKADESPHDAAWKKRVTERLSRARELAPELKGDLATLATELGL